MPTQTSSVSAGNIRINLSEKRPYNSYHGLERATKNLIASKDTMSPGMYSVSHVDDKTFCVLRFTCIKPSQGNLADFELRTVSRRNS